MPTPALTWDDIVSKNVSGPSFFRGLADEENPDALEDERYMDAAIDLLANLLDCGNQGDALDIDDEDMTNDERGEALQKAHEAAIDALARMIAAAPASGPEYDAGRKEA
jgi:hypothetical protein